MGKAWPRQVALSWTLLWPPWQRQQGGGARGRELYSEVVLLSLSKAALHLAQAGKGQASCPEVNVCIPYRVSYSIEVLAR